MLSITKEEYKENMKRIERILYDSIVNGKHSKINIVYNHYYNISKIELIKKQVLPVEKRNEEKNTFDTYREDFVVEGDINDILINIVVLYVLYEIKIATENSYASENIMRQTITKESLKRIDDIEFERKRIKLKLKKNLSFKKTLENYTNIKRKTNVKRME